MLIDENNGLLRFCNLADVWSAGQKELLFLRMEETLPHFHLGQLFYNGVFVYN